MINYVTVIWVFLVVVIRWLWWRKNYKQVKRSKVKSREKMINGGEIPRGNQGWPLIGETLDFIACGYSSRPVSFMEKRKSL